MGAVTFTVRPLKREQSLPAFHLTDRGEIVRLEAVVLGPRASERAVHRELTAALKDIELEHIPLDVKFELSGHEKRLYILIIAHTSTGMRLGRDHLFQERFSTLDLAIPCLVQGAVDNFKMELDHGGCVDEYMLDQLAVYQALAKGRSTINVGTAETSLHAKTAHWVAEELLGVSFDNGACEGVGWTVGAKWQRRRGDDDDLADSICGLNVDNEDV